MKLNSLENVCDICRVISSFVLRFIFWEKISRYLVKFMERTRRDKKLEKNGQKQNFIQIMHVYWRKNSRGKKFCKGLSFWI